MADHDLRGGAVSGSRPVQVFADAPAEEWEEETGVTKSQVWDRNVGAFYFLPELKRTSLSQSILPSMQNTSMNSCVKRFKFREYSTRNSLVRSFA